MERSEFAGGLALPSPSRSTRYVEDSVRLFGSLGQYFYGFVERITSSIFRLRAFLFAPSITGRHPYRSVPTTRRRHFQGTFSSTETGVCPNCSRNFFEGFFLRLRIFATVDAHIVRGSGTPADFGAGGFPWACQAKAA